MAERRIAAEANVDACLFFSSEKEQSRSMKRLIGVAGEGSSLMTFKRKQPIYFHSPLEKPPTLEGVTVKRRKRECMIEVLKRMKPTRIGLDHEELTKKEYDLLTRKLKKELKHVTFVDVSEMMRQRRQIKTTEEKRILKTAIARTEQVLKQLIERLKDMDREHEAIVYLKKRVLELGDELSFEPIVASGGNSRNPHYEPTRTSKIKKGFCIIDFGIKHKGYCADITRTVFIGTPTREDIDFYNKVKNEQKRLEKTLKAGMEKVKPTFEMVHAVGHGIGLDVHETPLIGYEPLKENATVAVEPALYDKQGVRIEDDYEVSATGLKRLSRTSRELTIIR